MGHGAIRKIAEGIGKDPSYVSRMLYPPTKTGYKRIGEDSVEDLDRAFPGWMTASQSAEMPAGQAVTRERPLHVRLAVLEVFPSAGHGGEPVDYPVVMDYMEFPEAWAHHKLGRDLSKYRLLPVSGDSMSPTINDGDLAFVDTSIQGFDSEGIYVIIWNDRLLIKRLRAVLATQRIEIRSDNSGAYGAETVSMDELARLHICGLVRCWWSIKGA